MRADSAELVHEISLYYEARSKNLKKNTNSSGERDVSFTYLSRVPLGTEKYFEALK
jgi:hypothetical protein